MPQLSVIIPTWNEAVAIEETIRALNREDCEIEVIVVDGGSTDHTCELARNAGADLVFVPENRGRANQMNAGAAKASTDSEWLLFLHADTLLPGHGLTSIIGNPESVVGGAFQRRFGSPSLFLMATAGISDFRSSRGIFLGDQAIFVRRSVFEEIGGYDVTLKICEDIDLSKRMASLGETALIPGPAISSARRFEKRGVLLQSVIDFWLTFRFLTAPHVFRH